MGASKIKKGKIKTVYFVIFQIKFVKMKSFYDFGPHRTRKKVSQLYKNIQESY